MEDPATLIMIAKGIATGLVALTILSIWAYVDTIIALHYEEKNKNCNTCDYEKSHCVCLRG